MIGGTIMPRRNRKKHGNRKQIKNAERKFKRFQKNFFKEKEEARQL